MTKQPSTRPRQVKSPRQRAEEALGVAERHTARLTATRDKLQGELEAVEKDLRAAVVRRDYLAANPDLGDPAQLTIDDAVSAS